MPTKESLFEEEKLKKNNDIKILLRLAPYAKPYFHWFILCLVLIFIVIALELSVPIIKKIAIDRYIVPQTESEDKAPDQPPSRWFKVDINDAQALSVVQRYPSLFRISNETAFINYEDINQLKREDLSLIRYRDLSGIMRITIIFLIVISASLLFSFFQVWLMEYIGQKIMHHLRMHLFEHTLNLSVTYHNRNPVGRLTTRVSNDIQNLNELFTSIIVFVLKDIFIVAGIMVIMIMINWRLALASLAVIPLVIWASVYFSKQVREVFRDLRVKIAEINIRFAEMIEGLNVIRLFRQEVRNYHKFKQLNHENYLAAMKQINLFSIFVPLVEFFSMLSIAIVIYYGGVNVLSDEISIGILVAFMSYMKMFFRPVRDMAEKHNIMQNALSSAERIFSILDNQDKERLVLSEHDPINKIEHIIFNKVSLSYTPNEMVLHGISFELKAGETIAFVGPTGAGKTSVINLMIRFYDPTSGIILLNGRNIQEIPAAFVRAKMAVVMQEPFLFSGSIKDNIFGKTASVSPEKISAVLEAAYCTELISRLPQGIDTVLTSSTSLLSSGERQLICIARALAREPDLIILDEATSYIDSHTEKEIQQAMKNLMQNRTAVIIAHRLSTAKNADKILVLSNGSIIESGSHEQLMQYQGIYYELTLQQH